MVLSAASLGSDTLVISRKTYKKNGISVTQLGGPRGDRTRRYKVCLIPHTLKWYPSKTENFVFQDMDMDPPFLLELAAEWEWNPSVWEHRKSKRYVVRVPKDRAEEVRERLYSRGLWYNPANNLWCKRRRRSRKKGYPSFVQSLGVSPKKRKAISITIKRKK